MRLAGSGQNRVVLRGMDAAAQHIAQMAFQRVVPAQPGIAGELGDFLHGGNGVAGDGVFDQALVGRTGAAQRGGIEHGAVGEQQCFHFAQPS